MTVTVIVIRRHFFQVQATQVVLDSLLFLTQLLADLFE
jgi:hypothetical protein